MRVERSVGKKKKQFVQAHVNACLYAQETCILSVNDNTTSHPQRALLLPLLSTVTYVLVLLFSEK